MSVVQAAPTTIVTPNPVPLSAVPTSISPVVAPAGLNTTSLPNASSSLPVAASVVVPLIVTGATSTAPLAPAPTTAPNCNITVQGGSYYRDPTLSSSLTLPLGSTDTIALGTFFLAVAMLTVCILFMNFNRGSAFANVLLVLMVVLFGIISGLVFKNYTSDKASLTRPCTDSTGKNIS